MSSVDPITPLLESLGHWFEQHRKGSISRDGYFKCAIRAALAKSYEFCLSSRSQPENADFFFSAATLRGVCEDLIVLSFLMKLPVSDRDTAIKIWLQLNVDEALQAQAKFFGQIRPWQLIVKPQNGSSINAKDELRQFAKRQSWKEEDKWPSVSYMARACSLSDLYGYIYAVTSKWVHFSPHLLLRMGWGDTPEAVNLDSEWSFSTKNFSAYHREFTQFYSTYLLMLLLSRFGPVVDAAGSFKEEINIIDTIQTKLNEMIRWPDVDGR
jgi:hypothetical protein